MWAMCHVLRDKTSPRRQTPLINALLLLLARRAPLLPRAPSPPGSSAVPLRPSISHQWIAGWRLVALELTGAVLSRLYLIYFSMKRSKVMGSIESAWCASLGVTDGPVGSQLPAHVVCEALVPKLGCKMQCGISHAVLHVHIPAVTVNKLQD